MEEHFTPRLEEKNRGVEFCCDSCNRKFDGDLEGHFDWFYWRYDVKSEWPYAFWCIGCSVKNYSTKVNCMTRDDAHDALIASVLFPEITE